MFVDSHCHLTFFKNIDEIVKNAAEKDVGVIVNCPDKNDFEKCIAISEKFAEVETCLGIYPVHAMEMGGEEISERLEFIEKNAVKIIGIGEIGLDYKHAKTEEQREKQEAVFVQQIDLAKKLGLPIVVHSRFAERETLEILEREHALNVLMHWYTNSVTLCKKASDLGYFISVGPRVVNGEQTQKVVASISLENLMLETDAPVPFEGKEAQPSWIPEVASKVAGLKKETVLKIAQITTANAKKLFNV